MKDTYEIYEVNIIFFILKNNDFFSVSGRSYAIGNCAIIKKKIQPQKPTDWIKTSERNSRWAKLKNDYH